MQFSMDAMQHCSMSNTSRGWLAGHPLSLQNIIMLLSMKSRTHSHRESFIGRTNWIQAIYENAHRICSFGIFCTSGKILARKIDSFIVHSYSYIHTHVINMHPFDSFHDQKSDWKCTTMCLSKFNANWFHSYEHWIYYEVVQSTQKRSNKSECEKKFGEFIEWIVLPVAFLAKNFQRSDFMVVLQEQISKTCRILLLHFASACVIINAHVIR